MKPLPAAAGAARRGHARSALLVVQVAASVALVALAGLLARSFLTLLPSSPGFTFEARSLFPVVLRPNLFPSPAHRLARAAELLRRVEAVPGVSSAALSSEVPFSGDYAETAVRSPEAEAQSVVWTADLRAISPNFFDVLEIPLAAGRFFTRADGPDAARVALVNRTLARRLAADGDVVGRSIRVGRSSDAPLRRIVGVVADARASGTSLETRSEVYVPYEQNPSMFAYLIVQSRLEAAALTSAIRREIRSVLPNLPLRSEAAVLPMSELLRRALAPARFSATLLGSFAALALLLSVVGVFGLVAYSTSERRRELGIRAALGARPRDLVATCMRSAVGSSVAGIAFGLVAAAYLTRFVESQLYAIGRFDPTSFGGAAALLLLAASLAAFLPARRSVTVDPIAALREE
jgi:predicted permease